MARTVRGMGVNDVKFAGKTKAYSVWYDMLTRCYNNETRRKEHITYIGYTVCKEWLLFSRFNNWHNKNYRCGFELDKDVMGDHNKVYSPLTCAYVPKEVNLLFNTRDAARGDCPMGVTFNKQHKKYYSQINIDGRTISLGIFNNPDDARLAYVPVKNKYLHEKLQQHVKLGNITADYAILAYFKFSLKKDDNNV